jgi:hypothetical protein
MFKALQYLGAGVMGLIVSKGALEIAGALSSRGSLTYILTLIAFAPVVILVVIGMATAPSLATFSVFGHRGHNPED